MQRLDHENVLILGLALCDRRKQMLGLTLRNVPLSLALRHPQLKSLKGLAPKPRKNRLEERLRRTCKPGSAASRSVKGAVAGRAAGASGLSWRGAGATGHAEQVALCDRQAVKACKKSGSAPRVAVAVAALAFLLVAGDRHLAVVHALPGLAKV